MGSKSSSKKSSSNVNNVVNSTLTGDNVYQVANSSGNTITFTDQGAIKEAFGAFDSANDTINNALQTVSAGTDKSIAALKEFATQLTVGDYAGTRYIAFAVIAAVVIAGISASNLKRRLAYGQEI